MNKDDHFSEEQLNAFVDGELDSEEQSCLFDVAERSVELDQRVCQQRKLKDLVKHAYQEIPEPRRQRTRQPTRFSMLGLAMAASVLLVLGVTTGLLIHGYIDQNPNSGGLGNPTNSGAVATVDNYILHVVSGEPMQMKLALQKAGELLANAEPDKPRLVKVVANEQGLNLLRSDMTPFAKEISDLANEQVIFYACSRAIERLEEKGITVQLVPEAIPGYTALDRVVIRMKDGWQYIKI